jgi:sterol desaturase/sphingolipid hydroxylase (fatty acid hydroxylase superfamily)
MFYWLLVPWFRMVGRVIIAALIALFALALGERISPDLLSGFGPVAQQPKLLIVLEALVLTDFTSYWLHRLFHTVPFMWRFHAIHHSATEIRWSTTGRVHPINDILNVVVGMIPALLLGFPVSAVLSIVPVLAWYAVGAHTAWELKFGPLNAVFASPRYHRWHHTYSHEGGNKNFANVFSFWDRLFGTYHFPRDRKPETFGLDNNDMPDQYLAQLLYPFRRPQPESDAREPKSATSDFPAHRAPSNAPGAP